MSATQRTASRCSRAVTTLVEPVRRPPRRPLADHVGERLLVVHQPAVRLLEGEVDQAVVGVVGDDLLQQPTGDR